MTIIKLTKKVKPDAAVAITRVSAVYAYVPEEEVDVKEEQVTKLIYPYMVSKLATEVLAPMFVNVFGLHF